MSRDYISKHQKSCGFRKYFMCIICCFLLLLLIIYFESTSISEVSFYISKVQYPTDIPERDRKYLTYTCYEEGFNFGNQLWMLLAGWSTAKYLGRSLYHNCEPAIPNINLITDIFPRIAGEFEYLSPNGSRKVTLAQYQHHYVHPRVLENFADRYLEVDMNNTQDARYFQDDIQEIRDRLFEFGANVTDEGEKAIQELINVKKKNLNDLLCAHITQTDYITMDFDRNYSDVFHAIKHVATMSLVPRTLLIFGDDPKFMTKLLDELYPLGIIANDSFYSSYPRATDFYLAKTVCTTFCVTSEGSTFGFWLALLMNRDDEVYYSKDFRPGAISYYQPFPLPWHAIKVSNTTTTLLN